MLAFLELDVDEIKTEKHYESNTLANVVLRLGNSSATVWCFGVACSLLSAV